MANTRDTIGDQATVDGLVNRTLTSLEEDGVLSLCDDALYHNTALETVNLPAVTSVGRYAFGHCTALKEVTLPKVTSITQEAFDSCPNLEKVDCGKTGGPAVAIGSNVFNACPKMNALILRSSSVSTLSISGGLSGTAIANGAGAVYVPTELVDTYKANANWKPYFIYPISSYPATLPVEISDTWAEIFDAEEDGTYKIKYQIGDTKALTINNATYHAQIVAFDADDLTAGGKAKITWIIKELYADEHKMNASYTTTDGWAATEMRTWLRDTILPTIDSTVRNEIKEVTKTYYDRDTTSTKTIADTVWIPSYREIFGDILEDSGCDYTAWFNSSDKRIKKRNGSVGIWWLRSTYSDSDFRLVQINGSYNNDYATFSHGVALGFCT